MRAAVQGENLANEVRYSVCTGFYMDFADLSMGVETIDGSFEIFLARGKLILTHKPPFVSTTTDNQEKMTRKIWKGERKIANKSQLLGSLDLAGLPPKSKGLLTVEIALAVNADRVLSRNC